MILKGWFPDIDVLKIYPQVNREEYDQDTISNNYNNNHGFTA